MPQQVFKTQTRWFCLCPGSCPAGTEAKTACQCMMYNTGVLLCCFGVFAEAAADLSPGPEGSVDGVQAAPSQVKVQTAGVDVNVNC